MKKITYILSSLFCLSLSQSIAQDTLVVMKAGQAVYKRVVTEVDSIVFKPNSKIVKDIDDNVYPTIIIGTQVWMGENLRVEKYNDGTAIPLVTENTVWLDNAINQTKLPMMSWYDNDKATHFDNKDGALYNWYVVNTGKLCPTGWHVPSNNEWNTLINYLGGETVAGGKLKSNTGWSTQGGVNGTNEVNFSAVPSGLRSPNFNTFNFYGYWWTTTEKDSMFSWTRYMSYGNGVVYTDSNNQSHGLSVRCLKD